MKKCNLMLRTFCFLFTLILIFSCLPIYAFEEENNVIPPDVLDSSIVSEDVAVYDEPIDDNIIVNVTEPTEIVARRDRNVKHYLMPDGKMQAIVHGKAIHRKDENGKWQDIDNSLYTVDNGVSSKFATKDNRVVFAKSYIKDQPLLTLSENGYSISMSHISDSITSNEHITRAANVDLTSKAATVKNTSTELVPIEDVKQIYSRSSVTYSINRTVDIEYLLDGDDVKENILISSPQTDYTYTFKLELDGLYAELHDDGYVNIFDSETNERQYVIPTPFMFDKSGAFSDDVDYTLTQSGDDYILSVVADSEWANSEERAYPISMQAAYIDVGFSKDLYIDSANQYANYGDATELIVGQTQIAFFDFAYDWPKDLEFDNVTFYVSYRYPDNNAYTWLDVGLYPIIQPWEENWVWAHYVCYPSTIANGIKVDTQTLSTHIGSYISNSGLASFDITNLAQWWQDGAMPCYGIALKREDGSSDSVTLYSCESDVEHAPYFTILYSQTVNDGVYKLKNVNNGLYLDTTNGGYTDGTLMQQWSGSSDDNNLSQMFKITNIGINLETGKQVYSIRPMTNSGLGLYAKYRIGEESTQAKVKNITTEENKELMSNFQRWNIELTENGYIFSNDAADTTTYLATLLNNSTNGMAVCMRETTESNREWILEEYTGDAISVVEIISYSSVINTYDNVCVNARVYSTDIGKNGPVTFSIINDSGRAQIDSTGNLLAFRAGTFKVVAQYRSNSDNRNITAILPISGYEVEYNPDLWNNKNIINKTNCYSYVLNYQYIPGTNIIKVVNPGYFGNYFYKQEDIDRDVILDAAYADSSALGFTFNPISKYDVCTNGAYKIALVVDPGKDYHWYRQNPDGTWSHKRGKTEVINYDASGNLIYDPEYADRDYTKNITSDNNYYVYVGCFEVTPFNTVKYDTNTINYSEKTSSEDSCYFYQELHTSYVEFNNYPNIKLYSEIIDKSRYLQE